MARMQPLQRLFGDVLSAVLPAVDPLGDASAAYADLLDRVRVATVVLFEGVLISRLDDVFRLRLAQIVGRQPVLAGLSVVCLAEDKPDLLPAGGFAQRFRTSWPFARALFVAPDAALAAAWSSHLNVPVVAESDVSDAPPTIDAAPVSGQRVALQIQPLWGRCGSTTAFQNQIEDCVAGGYFTIRLFAEAGHRQGATLARTLRRIVPENNRDAGAHVTIAAVPHSDRRDIAGTGDIAAWAGRMVTTADCRLADGAVATAVSRADVVIANHLERVGLAIRLAPAARLILDVHDDIAAAYRQLSGRGGTAGTDMDKVIAGAEAIQAAILPIPDLCTHVNVTELQDLGRFCRQAAIVLPRVPIIPRLPPSKPSFDILLVGDAHLFNIASVAWFLDSVWQPYLRQHNVRVAVAGRVQTSIDTSHYDSALVTFLGFVEDLEALRATCRMSVVPDQAGSGIAVKLLTAIAAGHPLSTTTAGARGLALALAERLQPCRDAPGLAADILSVLDSDDALAARTDRVRRVQQAITYGQRYADCMAALPAPDAARQTERVRRWRALAAMARLSTPVPRRFGPGDAFPMSGSDADSYVLGHGWHGAEDWGRWMDGQDAILRIDLTQPVDAALDMQFDFMKPAAAQSLTLGVDNTTLPAIEVAEGLCAIRLPAVLVSGRRSLRLNLHVSSTFCPAEAGHSNDGRVLGAGIKSFRILSTPPSN